MKSTWLWWIFSAASVCTSVAVTLLLMSISAGVEHEVNAMLGVQELQGFAFLDVGRINGILHALTWFIAVVMIVQTAMTTCVIGVVLMNSRQSEIGIRRQDGAARRKIVAEFMVAMAYPVLIGAVVGEILGLALSRAIVEFTVLPIEYTRWSLGTAFPTTVVIAMAAVWYSAYKYAGQSLKVLQDKG